MVATVGTGVRVMSAGRKVTLAMAGDGEEGLGYLLTQRFDAVTRIGKLKMPLLVVHGDEDSLIPPQLGRMLFDAAPNPKRFELVLGGTHFNTNAVGQSQYREAIAELFDLST